jgi:hypothetical protein
VAKSRPLDPGVSAAPKALNEASNVQLRPKTRLWYAGFLLGVSGVDYHLTSPLGTTGDATLYREILDKCSLQSLKVKLESLDLISLAPDLRHLQLQTATFGKEQADMIAAACPRLTSMTLTSTKLSMNPAVNFSVFPRLEELALADVQLGKIEALPAGLLSFTATIGVMATNCTRFLRRMTMKISVLTESSM